MERYFEIADALIKSGGVVYDEHNGGSETRLLGLAALMLGDKVVTVGLQNADFFSLNRVFLQDDKVHLSADSVGGTLFPVNFKDLWECINDYNEKQITNKFSCGTLENVMSLKPVPVTVITITVAEFNERVRITSERLAVAEELLAVTADEPVPDAECVAAREALTEAIGGKEVKHLISKTEAGPWLLEKLATDGTRSEGALLPPPRTQVEIEEMGQLVASGLSPEEANKQFVSRRKMTSLNADFLPGNEDEIQEAYYREQLAKKETGVTETKAFCKHQEIPSVAGYNDSPKS